MITERAAGFILYRDVHGRREYLIVKNRGGGAWGFPKGRVEPGEAPQAAARREVAEEVGITHLEPVPGFEELLRYSFLRAGNTVDKKVVLFLARTDEPGEALPREIQAITWLPYEEALTRLTHAEQRELLKQAEAVLADPDCRR
ncbi:MAG: NUDIX domain-containing protein [Candidatus Bipolaricaulota bacterium]